MSITPVHFPLSNPYPRDKIVTLLSEVSDHCNTLTESEALAVVNSVEKRRREFSTGRWLAHRALSQLGTDLSDLLPGPTRAPQWPDSTVGSLAHTDQYAITAVAQKKDIIGLGIDIEHENGVEPNMIEKLLTRSERDGINDQDPTLIFSAKESVYKLIYPIVGGFVDFQEVEISIDRETSAFSARYVGDNQANILIEQAQGAYKKMGDHWITFIVLS